MNRKNAKTAKGLIIATIIGIQGIVANLFGASATAVNSATFKIGGSDLSSHSTAASSETTTPAFFGFGEKSLSDKLEGSWQSISGPKEKLTFEKTGGVSILIYGDSSYPNDITTRGSFKVTGDSTFTILEGGEYSDGALEDGTLSITKRGGLTSKFTKQ